MTRTQKRYLLFLVVIVVTLLVGRSMAQQAAQQESQGLTTMCRAGVPVGQLPPC